MKSLLWTTISDSVLWETVFLVTWAHVAVYPMAHLLVVRSDNTDNKEILNDIRQQWKPYCEIRQWEILMVRSDNKEILIVKYNKGICIVRSDNTEILIVRSDNKETSLWATIRESSLREKTIRESWLWYHTITKSSLRGQTTRNLHWEIKQKWNPYCELQ